MGRFFRSTGRSRRFQLGTPLLKRFLRSRQGAVAVEFAMVVIPFVAIIMVILEASYLFVIRESLDNALSTAARQILTGQAQTSSGATAITDSNSFIQYAFCPNVPSIINCNSTNVKVNVQQYGTGSFSSVSLGAPITAGTLDTSSWGYNACQSTSGTPAIMKVELVYPVSPVSSFFTFTNTALVGGKQSRVLYSTVVFRCEPF